jgi:hypothetical protein
VGAVESQFQVNPYCVPPGDFLKGFAVPSEEVGSAFDVEFSTLDVEWNKKSL